MTTQKTENDLDPRFQWNETLDPDHIFTEELTMVKELRGRVPQLEKESDKFIACFLFARRHNIEETVDLLTKFYKKKQQYSQYFQGQHIPSFKYTNNLTEKARAGSASMLQPKGYRDNKGRMLRYFLMGQDRPGDRSLEYTYVNFIWQTYYMVATEPVNAWRNGVCIVVDLKRAGIKNLDLSSKGRELHSAMQGTFPFRVRSMLVVNGGFLINTLLGGAKICLPKKLYDRIKPMHEEKLKQYITSENLLPQFGGSAPSFTFEDYLKEIQQNEERLFTKEIWTTPDGATL